MKVRVAVGARRRGADAWTCRRQCSSCTAADPVLDPPIVAPGGLLTATLDNYCNSDNEARQLLFDVESGRQSFVSCHDDGLAIATLQAPRRVGKFYVLVDTLNGDTTATIEVQAGLSGPDDPLPDTALGTQVWSSPPEASSSSPGSSSSARRGCVGRGHARRLRERTDQIRRIRSS